MTVFDTNILIGALHGNKAAEAAIETYNDRGAAITILNKYELVRGAKPLEEPIISDFLLRFKLYGLDDAALDEAVAIYGSIKSRRTKINEFDILIAGIAAANNEMLVTADTDFSGMGKHIVLIDL